MAEANASADAWDTDAGSADTDADVMESSEDVGSTDARSASSADADVGSMDADSAAVRRRQSGYEQHRPCSRRRACKRNPPAPSQGAVGEREGKKGQEWKGGIGDAHVSAPAESRLLIG